MGGGIHNITPPTRNHPTSFKARLGYHLASGGVGRLHASFFIALFVFGHAGVAGVETKSHMANHFAFSWACPYPVSWRERGGMVLPDIFVPSSLTYAGGLESIFKNFRTYIMPRPFWPDYQNRGHGGH